MEPLNHDEIATDLLYCEVYLNNRLLKITCKVDAWLYESAVHWILKCGSGTQKWRQWNTSLQG